MRGQDGIGWGELWEKTLANASLTDADADRWMDWLAHHSQVSFNPMVLHDIVWWYRSELQKLCVFLLFPVQLILVDLCEYEYGRYCGSDLQ